MHDAGGEDDGGQQEQQHDQHQRQPPPQQQAGSLQLAVTCNQTDVILSLHYRTFCFWDVKAPADPSEHTSGDSTLLGCEQQGVLRDGGLLRLVAVDEDGDGHGVAGSPPDCALISSEQEGGGEVRTDADTGNTLDVTMFGSCPSYQATPGPPSRHN